MDNQAQKLRRQLNKLLTEARANDEKLRRFNQQELNLIATTSLQELVRYLLHDLKAAFSLDAVSLMLLDPEYELSRMLEMAELAPEAIAEVTIASEAETLSALYAQPSRPVLGTYCPADHAHLFPDQAPPPATLALLPLLRSGELIGSLHFGSRDARRFCATSGTDFLQRLATIVAICLENCANHERLKLIGLTDSLTRVSNRRHFEQRFEEEIAIAERHRQPLACMFLDVDRFKPINDTHGHQVGDAVLCDIADHIKAQLRSNDTVARYGGEEFVVLLPNAGREQAEAIAERIREAVQAHRFALTDGQMINVTISIGVAVLSDAPTLPLKTVGGALIEAADQAVYRAKEQGRNRVVFAAPLKLS